MNEDKKYNKIQNVRLAMVKPWHAIIIKVDKTNVCV